MKTLPQYVLGYVLAALVVIATVVLLATSHTVPGWFESLAVFSAGGSTGAVIAGKAEPAVSSSAPSLPPIK